MNALGLLIALAVVLPQGTSQPKPHPTPPLRLSNATMQIGLDARSGSLVELIDRAVPHNHLEGVTDRGGLWELHLGRSSEARTIGSQQAKCFRAEQLAAPRAGLRLIWKDFGVAAAPELRVEATVELDPHQPASRWNIVLEHLGGQTVHEVCFPRIPGMARQHDERLAVPVWMGQQLANPRKLLAGAQGRGRRLVWYYPGPLSMQCLAFYQENGPGLYVACDDTAALRKGFAVWGDGTGRVGVEVLHCPAQPTQPPNRYSLGYHVVLATFQGDWFTAAERYRSWALQQDWARQSRLRRGLVPEWVTNTGAWVWNRGRSPQVLPPALAFQERLGLPVGVFWHWWHGCAYDIGFPEYLPPREGTLSFRTAVSEAQSRGIHALVYMNQRLWGTTTPSWHEEHAERFAVRGPDGSILHEVYNVFTRQPCAPMCIGTEFWRAKYAGLAEQAWRELGIDGIYMDQACLTLPCYARDHGHAPGGGNFWPQGFRSLAAELRRRCTGDVPESRKEGREPGKVPGRPPIALAGEGCGETWLDSLDLMLSLQVSKERYAGSDEGWEVIPLFHAVYHPYVVLYGNYASLTVPPYDELWPAQFAPKEPLALLDRKYSTQFRMEQARAFVWGQQPTIANFLPTLFDQRLEEIDYVIRLAKIRRRALEYLLYGTMLRPPVLPVPQIWVDCSRLSVYAGRQGGITSFQKQCPAVLAAAWQAPDGRVAVALASLVDQPLELPLFLEQAFSARQNPNRIYRIDDSGRHALPPSDHHLPGPRICLSPWDACVIEVYAPPGGR